MVKEKWFFQRPMGWRYLGVASYIGASFGLFTVATAVYRMSSLSKITIISDEIL
jgi:hypothetical protein